MRLSNEIDLRAARGIFRLSKLPPQMQRERPSSIALDALDALDRSIVNDLSGTGGDVFTEADFSTALHCTANRRRERERERERERGGEREVSAEKLREEEEDSRKPSIGCCG